MKQLLAACLCLAVLVAGPISASQCPTLLRLVEQLPEGSIMAEVLIALGATDEPPAADPLPTSGGATGPIALRRRLQAEAVACPMIYAPVCGSDGQTYSNKCMALGAEIECQGECPCGSTGGGGGGGDERLPATGGTAVGGSGMDTPICMETYKPVCTADGQTYANSCKAMVAGQPVVCNGECPCPDLIAALQSGSGLLLVPTDDSLLASLDQLNATDADWLSDTALLQQLLARHVILTASQTGMDAVPQPSLEGTPVVTEAAQRVQLVAASKQRPGFIQLAAPSKEEIDILQTFEGCQLGVMQIEAPLQGPTPGF